MDGARERPLLCLVAILKDEAGNIRETLASVRDYVDTWAILDTGSTDGTQAIVERVMRSVSGFMEEAPFIDFAASRNRTLDMAVKWTDVLGHRADGSLCPAGAPVFTLTLSGDEVLHGGAALRAFLETKRDAPEGAYAVEMESAGVKWTYPRVLRTSAGWRYKGAVHEVPVGPKGETDGPLVPGVKIVHTVTDMARRFRRYRDFDFPTLQRMVEDESVAIEDRAQAIWFLAQTHEALADEHPRTAGGPWLSHKMAAMALYMRRAEIGGPDKAKVNYARFRFLNVAESIGFYDDGELLARLEPLAKAEPTLPEVRYMIAVHAAQMDARRGLLLAEEAAKVAREARAKPTHLPTDARLEWLSLRLAAECAWALGNKKRARELAARGMNAGGTPADFSKYMA